jgi:Fe2+ or Zn2+ uptake regulation protein
MVCKQHAKQFQTDLKSRGLKATPKRLGILDFFAHVKKPVSICELKSKISPKADLVTLYRNLEVFTKLGLLSRIWLGDKKEYFEFAKNKHHHHLVCTACGRVSDIESCIVGDIPKQSLAAASFANIKNHQLEFFGICKKCN